MSTAPNTGNYTLGKGVLFFNQLVNGSYVGERDLGNAPSFTFSLTTEKLEHYSSRAGLRTKDKEIISQITPSLSFTLDEINTDNFNLLVMGDTETVSQTGGVATAEAITVLELGKRVNTAYRQIGSYRMNHGTVTNGPFQVGEACTSDNASPGAGTIVAVGSTYVSIVITSGLFEDGDTITGTTSTASADQVGAMAWNGGVFLVQDDADTITYVDGVEGTGNYQCMSTIKDDVSGRILINADQSSPSAAIAESDVLHVTYMYLTSTYTKIKMFQNTEIEGALRFASNNAAGGDHELHLWSVNIAPTGDTAMIGDDWSTLGFTGEIQKDETGHPDEPYGIIISDEVTS